MFVYNNKKKIVISYYYKLSYYYYHIIINTFDFDKFYEINISCVEEETRWKKSKKIAISFNNIIKIKIQKRYKITVK